MQWSGVEGCDACAQLEAAGCPGCTDCCPSPHCKLFFLQFIGKPSTVRYSRFSEEETSPKDSHGMEEDGSGSSSEDKRHEQVCCVSVCCHTLLFELPHQCLHVKWRVLLIDMQKTQCVCAYTHTYVCTVIYVQCTVCVCIQMYICVYCSTQCTVCVL